MINENETNLFGKDTKQPDRVRKPCVKKNDLAMRLDYEIEDVIQKTSQYGNTSTVLKFIEIRNNGTRNLSAQFHVNLF